ncbi:hypothetical protein EXIGLDRAFT_48324 [Exidia glandulosa HHB12029]|uniref:Uncharacterized protein n=1 Tax=Exidia glandulosa HHB12029 TaxID=1314781 RepID=A0A165P6T9_EXIGL|nr:hypothetical protein EXIGLDRAFT_48324 [Exidia glandulosa HHB12029]
MIYTTMSNTTASTLSASYTSFQTCSIQAPSYEDEVVALPTSLNPSRRGTVDLENTTAPIAERPANAARVPVRAPSEVTARILEREIDRLYVSVARDPDAVQLKVLCGTLGEALSDDVHGLCEMLVPNRPEV